MGVPKKFLSNNWKFAVTPFVLTPFVPFRAPRVGRLDAAPRGVRLQHDALARELPDHLEVMLLNCCCCCCLFVLLFIMYVVVVVNDVFSFLFIGLCLCMFNYCLFYDHLEVLRRPQGAAVEADAEAQVDELLRILWVALLVQGYLSNTASVVSCAVYSVKEHHDLQNDSPLLKKLCVRQAVSDKWFTLTSSRLPSKLCTAPGSSGSRARCRVRSSARSLGGTTCLTLLV